MKQIFKKAMLKDLNKREKAKLEKDKPYIIEDKNYKVYVKKQKTKTFNSNVKARNYLKKKKEKVFYGEDTHGNINIYKLK